MPVESYQLEDASGLILLEDGSGTLLLESSASGSTTQQRNSTGGQVWNVFSKRRKHSHRGSR